jgi:hypothetical protein
MTILDTGLAVESAYNGFVFSIQALEDIEVVALYAESECGVPLDCTLYTASGAWEACKTQLSKWKEVGTGHFTKVS